MPLVANGHLTPFKVRLLKSYFPKKDLIRKKLEIQPKDTNHLATDASKLDTQRNNLLDQEENNPAIHLDLQKENLPDFDEVGQEAIFANSYMLGW